MKLMHEPEVGESILAVCSDEKGEKVDCSQLVQLQCCEDADQYPWYGILLG